MSAPVVEAPGLGAPDSGAPVVSAPVAGASVPLGEVPDPVFSQEMLGPGLAIRLGEASSFTVCAPISGVLAVMKPHAFIIRSVTGLSVLVHLGIDTIYQDPTQFCLLGPGSEPSWGSENGAAKTAQGNPEHDSTWEVGDQIEAGAPIVRWHPEQPKDASQAPLVLVTLLEVPPGADVERLAKTEAKLHVGTPLLRVAVSQVSQPEGPSA